MSRKKRIFVADDDPGILDAITLILEEFGYEVETTIDGAKVHDIQHDEFDLLLLDIWMSGWNGRDICLALKSQPATKNLPIILISANKDTEKIAREAGADDFIGKPFELDELVEKIEKYI
ncbi:hypothetical protein KDA_58360 [Dictyobacter alpinus]|uniref:Response regulatory domain-containing protein n=1 Tax=Dictyobacter alpinus TaxID=2014873 RepID=A0A402BGG8_9CHLR|nr:response regulator transcription factor [Dictyobacter alpinus]GCE30320.1 hypothetical protein KDA_58040 [Dictyobacter alpinus]GCE30352.1 hypothetical protein KDA_58360 [Dictyobacter alpinus]